MLLVLRSSAFVAVFIPVIDRINGAMAEHRFMMSLHNHRRLLVRWSVSVEVATGRQQPILAIPLRRFRRNGSRFEKIEPHRTVMSGIDIACCLAPRLWLCSWGWRGFRLYRSIGKTVDRVVEYVLLFRMPAATVDFSSHLGSELARARMFVDLGIKLSWGQVNTSADIHDWRGRSRSGSGDSRWRRRSLKELRRSGHRRNHCRLRVRLLSACRGRSARLLPLHRSSSRHVRTLAPIGQFVCFTRQRALSASRLLASQNRSLPVTITCCAVSGRGFAPFPLTVRAVRSLYQERFWRVPG